MFFRLTVASVIFVLTVFAQDNQGSGWRKAGDAAEGAKPAENSQPGQYLIETGTRIPLGLLNSVSTKHSAEGDRIYLETVFPILANGRIVIPAGSYVAGTVTEVKRPGRVKGRGELFVFHLTEDRPQLVA